MLVGEGKMEKALTFVRAFSISAEERTRTSTPVTGTSS